MDMCYEQFVETAYNYFINSCLFTEDYPVDRDDFEMTAMQDPGVMKRTLSPELYEYYRKNIKPSWFDRLWDKYVTVPRLKREAKRNGQEFFW